MNSLDILTGATRRGVATSEFVVALIAIGLIVWAPPGRSIALAIVASCYAVARAIVKASTATALLGPVEPPVRLTEEHEIRRV